MDLKRQRLDLRTKLFNLIRERSFKTGRVVLASGKESNFYFDMKPTMLDPEGAGWLAELILNDLQGVQVDCVGGLVMGAVPIVSPVVMKSHEFGRSLRGFFIRKETKDHGTKKLIEGDDIKGMNVVILDDVTTSGGSAMQAVTIAEDAGANVTLVLSIVDRDEGASDLYAAEGIPFKRLFRADEFRGAAD
jgi:orotate phosphoribosyltransferase